MALLRHPEYYQYEFNLADVTQVRNARKRCHNPSFSTSLPKC